jgi:hypothetical protein
MAGDLSAARSGIVALLRPVLEGTGWNVRPYVRANPAPPELAVGVATSVVYGGTLAGHVRAELPLVAVLGLADDEQAQARADWLLHPDGTVLAVLRGAKPDGVHGQLRVVKADDTRIARTALGDVLVVDIDLSFLC